MFEPSLYEAIVRTGFRHRATRQADGSWVYMLRDKSGAVLLPARDWERIGEAYSQPVRAAKRRAMLIVFGFPFVILAFALFVGQALPHFVAITLLVGGLLGWVLSWLAWYPWKVFQASRIAEQSLRQYPRTRPVPLDPERAPRVLQLLFLVLVGPNLILSIIGEIGGPDTFRNTPMVGAEMGEFQYLALLIIVIWYGWPLLIARRRADH
ncbi:MAG: hypothetical protein RQ806_09395 [Erythrobacter sp.]|nr:hypothetical protein [Erythrobacter sp.]